MGNNQNSGGMFSKNKAPYSQQRPAIVFTSFMQKMDFIHFLERRLEVHYTMAEIAFLSMNGASIQEIATQRSNVKRATVGNQLRHLYKHLGISNREALVAIVCAAYIEFRYGNEGMNND